MSRLAFHLPDVGEGLGEAEIVAWAVGVGDEVREDQPIVSVSTDKSVVDIPAPASGRIVALGGDVGDVLPVGSLLALIEVVAGGDGEEAPPAAGAAPQPSGAPARAAVRAAPSTRRLATQLDVDLAAVDGAGPNGRITADDVRAAAAAAGGARAPEARDAPGTEAPPPAPAPAPPPADETVPLRGIRRQVARTMSTAWQVPHITDFREVDASELVRAHGRLRRRLADRGIRLTFMPLFVKAVAVALRAHPRFNARIDVEGGTITYLAACHIGIATATDDGLVVPVLRDADRKSLQQVAEELARLAETARGARLEPGDTAEGTFTISNFGSYGTRLGTPIIRPPEVGIVGFGRIADAVVPVDGQPAVRPVLPLAVTTDHRLNDGAGLGAFAATLTDLLADPVLLLDA